MVTTQERDLDGSVFKISQLPAMRAFKLLAQLAKLFGPAVATISKPNSENLGLLFSGLEPSILEDVTRQLLEGCVMDGQPLMPRFDLAMQGRMGTLLKLLGFALEVNYASFFPGIDALKAKLSASVSPITSSGLVNG